MDKQQADPARLTPIDQEKAGGSAPECLSCRELRAQLTTLAQARDEGKTSDWVALSLASHDAHRKLTDALAREDGAFVEAVQLLVISADRALLHFERIRGDREDSDLMWALRRGMREVRSEMARALASAAQERAAEAQVAQAQERQKS